MKLDWICSDFLPCPCLERCVSTRLDLNPILKNIGHRESLGVSEKQTVSSAQVCTALEAHIQMLRDCCWGLASCTFTYSTINIVSMSIYNIRNYIHKHTHCTHFRKTCTRVGDIHVGLSQHLEHRNPLVFYGFSIKPMLKKCSFGVSPHSSAIVHGLNPNLWVSSPVDTMEPV